MIEVIRTHREANVEIDYSVAGYSSDTIDIKDDKLNIKKDVYTITAVMLAKSVRPPLAIGLFGDWGTGKSFFMKSIQSRAREVAGESLKKQNSIYCSSIVQIEFNAWHYVDTNLWASLVSSILEELAIQISPESTPEQQQASFLAELNSTKTILEQAKAERARTQKEITDRQEELQTLQKERQEKRVSLSELTIPDLVTLLTDKQKKEIDDSLEKMGIYKTMNSVNDLQQVIGETNSLSGRLTAVFLSVINGRNPWLLTGLLAVIIVVIPLIYWLFTTQFNTDNFVTKIIAISTQVIAIITGITVFLRRGLSIVNTGLKKVEDAKEKIDLKLAEIRKNPTPQEDALRKEITDLNTKEQEIAAKLTVATSRVIELEQRISGLQEEKSLSRFLQERTKSDDYRKHLGLISTVRKDFEALGKRLASPSAEQGLKKVDRIILYIDDLDRCPAEKVLEVLQAVHLLLAFPLFVVVVGVDPRWLLHSLQKTHSAFSTDGSNKGNGAAWQPTPQNFLEKIFQIPFSLKPMSDYGYGELINGLFATHKKKSNGSGTENHERDNQQNNAGQQPSDPHGPTPRDGQKATPKTENIDSTSGGKKPPGDENANTDKEANFEITEEALTIKDWEADFAEQLFSFIPNARAAKRFTNIYRILKAQLPAEQIRAFEGTAEMPGLFQIPMLLLAILIHSTSESAKFFPVLYKHLQKGENVNEALKNLTLIETTPAEFQTLSMIITPVVSQIWFPFNEQEFMHWIPKVSRFSFDLGKVIQGSED
jgi:hypothetical protein